MLRLFLFMIVSVSLSARAESSNISLKCVTESTLTTSFIVVQNGATIYGSIVNHNGMGYAPFWSSLITPNDLTILQKKAEVISKLNPVLKFEFDQKGCTIEGADVFDCVSSGKDFVSNGLKVHPWALYTTDTTQKFTKAVHNKKSVTLLFEIDGESYSLSMDYSPTECTTKFQ